MFKKREAVGRRLSEKGTKTKDTVGIGCCWRNPPWARWKSLVLYIRLPKNLRLRRVIQPLYLLDVAWRRQHFDVEMYWKYFEFWIYWKKKTKRKDGCSCKEQRTNKEKELSFDRTRFTVWLIWVPVCFSQQYHQNWLRVAVVVLYAATQPNKPWKSEATWCRYTGPSFYVSCCSC